MPLPLATRKLTVHTMRRFALWRDGDDSGISTCGAAESSKRVVGGDEMKAVAPYFARRFRFFFFVAFAAFGGGGSGVGGRRAIVPEWRVAS